jgi:hypothetical protein
MRLKIIIVFFMLSGCTSLHKKLLNAPLGQTKRQVLHQFSNPIKKFRKSGQDVWFFESVTPSKLGSEKILYTHIFTFEDNLMIKKTFKRSFTQKEISEFGHED